MKTAQTGEKTSKTARKPYAPLENREITGHGLCGGFAAFADVQPAFRKDSRAVAVMSHPLGAPPGVTLSE